MDFNIEDFLNNKENEMVSVINFEYFNKKVRTIYKNGEIWFVAKDVAEVLGYKNPQEAIRDHCKGVSEMLTPSEGGMQLTKIIPESDVYRLIFKSKLPEAEKFEDWVTKDVLPSIRKTGKYDINNKELSYDEKRVLLRNLSKDEEKNVHKTLKEHASMTDGREFAIWHAKGYQALYNLETPYHATKQIAQHKGVVLEKGDSILDFMSMEELAINVYHVTQAEAVIKRGNYTPETANNETLKIGKAIREEIILRGNRPPEEIPFEEHIKETEKRLKHEKQHKIKNVVVTYDGLEYDSDKLKDSMLTISNKIDVSNIWVIAVILAYFNKDGKIYTSELLEILPKYYPFSDEDKELTKSRGQPKYIQKIKNIKSNKNRKTNPINLGYFEEIKDGFQITQKGINFVKQYFEKYLVENKYSLT